MINDLIEKCGDCGKSIIDTEKYKKILDQQSTNKHQRLFIFS